MERSLADAARQRRDTVGKIGVVVWRQLCENASRSSSPSNRVTVESVKAVKQKHAKKEVSNAPRRTSCASLSPLSLGPPHVSARCARVASLGDRGKSMWGGAKVQGEYDRRVCGGSSTACWPPPPKHTHTHFLLPPLLSSTFSLLGSCAVRRTLPCFYPWPHLRLFFVGMCAPPRGRPQ